MSSATNNTPSSPTKRRASIKKKRKHKKLLEQKALNQKKKKMDRRRKQIEDKRLDELNNARDGLISKEERLAMSCEKHERELREIEEEKKSLGEAN